MAIDSRLHPGCTNRYNSSARQSNRIVWHDDFFRPGSWDPSPAGTGASRLEQG
jgi:hypothetical protein